MDNNHFARSTALRERKKSGSDVAVLPFAASCRLCRLFDSQTCQSLNPVIYKLTFYLIIVQYVLMLMPCLLLLCLAPAVYCCLPLLIRMSLVLPPGVGLRMLDQQGASESLISKLPPPLKFERGMFGSSKQPPPTLEAAGQEEQKSGSPAAVNHEEPEW